MIFFFPPPVRKKKFFALEDKSIAKFFFTCLCIGFFFLMANLDSNSNKILFLNPLYHKSDHCGLPPLRNTVHYCLKLARKIFPISSDEEPFCQHTTVLA